MVLELGKVHGWIVNELVRCRPVSDAMASFIARCEAAHPHPDWARLASLPYANLSPLVKWIQRPFREEPPARPLRGLWFGLFNPCLNGEPLADMYVSGSERFDSTPGSNAWAVHPYWWPESREAASVVLAAIYRIAYRDGGLGNYAEYPLCLGYGAFAVRELLSLVDPAPILGDSDSIGVAVGFDSGDFVLLGELRRSGLALPPGALSAASPGK
jgi:hypothetical protein